MNVIRRLAVAAVFGTLALLGSAHLRPAEAAPFCVQSEGVPPQCLYFDAAACRKNAIRVGGVCTADLATLRPAFGPVRGQYCMVDSTMTTSCVYTDRATCTQDATRHGAACVAAAPLTPLTPQTSPDPYRDIRR